MALAYARKHIPHGKILLAGSSVHVDKQLYVYAPAVALLTHY